MLYQFHITLAEEDYLAFNIFHSFGSNHGKKAIMKTRIFYVAAMAFLMLLVVLIMGWTNFSMLYTGLLGSFTLFYMLLFKKIMQHNMKAQIKRMKKMGRLPYDAVSTLEFYQDKMVEISPSSRTEQGYDIFERVCVLKDRYILLYRSSVSAYILPVPQVSAQTNQDAFLSFLSQKCKTIEHY